jgi:hypothetical protein
MLMFYFLLVPFLLILFLTLNVVKTGLYHMTCNPGLISYKSYDAAYITDFVSFIATYLHLLMFVNVQH